MPYIGKSPSVGLRTRYNYTATAGQTSFSGADNNNVTLTYTDTNYTDVYLNGTLLLAVTDYASTTGTSIVLTSGASLNDVLEVVVYDAFSVADTVSAVDGGAFVSNVSFGADISSSTLGTSNFRAGVNAGNSIASGGNYNVVVGDEAGTAITTGDQNTAVGYRALFTNSTGGNNVALGAYALDVNTTGASNTALGYLSLSANTTGTLNVAVGKDSMDSNTTGSNNVAVGVDTLQANTTANNNTAVGYAAGLSVTTGTLNTLIGSLAGDALTTGGSNVAVGYFALTTDDVGSKSVAVGTAALGAQNYATATDGFNVAVGQEAGRQVTTGIKNTIIGGLAADAMTSGQNNVFVGYAAAGAGVVTGSSNIGIGVAALGPLTSGANNVAIGEDAGPGLTTGSNNLFLGHDAGRTGSPGGNQTTGNGSICLGDENIGDAYIQVDWTVASDQRDKTDFTALDLGLNFVKALAPVTYKWDKRSKYGDKSADDYDLNAQSPDGTHKEDWLDIGFKAQEVQALEEAAGYTTAAKKNLTVSTSGDGKQIGLQYSKFVPILVKAMQEQNALIEALTARVATLEG